MVSLKKGLNEIPYRKYILLINAFILREKL